MRHALGMTLGSAVLASVLVGPLLTTAARADVYRLELDPDTPGGVICLPIDPAGACSDSTCDGHCASLGALVNTVCVYGPNSTLCCDGDRDCSVDGMAGSCNLLAGLSSGAGAPVFGVCEYTGAMYCGGTTADQIAPCLPSAGADWSYGDCDRDGLPNAMDSEPCTANDAGVGNDLPDAGGIDAGTPSFDGGVGGATAIFGGGGGCACRAGRATRVDLRPLVLAMIAGLWLSHIRRTR
ncbi:MAG: hypothetical protein AB7S26_21900 [Sandaracinaceae bacterium]